MPRTHQARLVTAAAFCAAVWLGCASASHDRVGGVVAPAPVVLTLAVNGARDDVRDWVEAVGRLSHGSLRIQLDDARRTVSDVRAGRSDLAAVPARAVDAMGVPSFEGLLAPFAVDSYDLERRALSGELPRRMLGGIRPLGVTGVALLPGALERTLSDGRVLLRPVDFRYAAIGVRPSPLTAAALRRLGASARPLPAAGDIDLADGVAQSAADVVANRYAFVTPGRTLAMNVVWWPRVTVVVVSPRADEALTPVQREALRRAGTAAAAPAVRRLVRAEQDAVRTLCRPPHGDANLLQLTWATPSDLRALRQAERPELRRLRRDPVARATLAALGRLRRDTRPAGGPPVVCRDGAPRPFRPVTVARLRLTGTLRRTAERVWTGAVRSERLGRGRLVVRGPLLFRDFPVSRSMGAQVQLAGGELRGWIDVRVAPAGAHRHRWDGVGVVVRASRQLRPQRAASLRFSGITDDRRPDRVRGRLATDAPTGLR